ncbi:hypothetical protein M513_09397 [Trichuris suis]|uniref:PDZ domain-containing protein n=1 Tax=Trichuris suis TaxID=68888 RepID=A0A085LXK4_9BILA|nr:hypothetical protein M513_09397 [Trichuris suis]
MPRTNARINASIEHPELRPAETLPRGDSPRATVQASDDHVGLFIFLSNKRSPSLSSTTSFITLIDGWLASDEEDRGLQTMDDEEILEFISKEPAETEEEPQYGDDEEEERPVASSDSEAFRCAEVLMQCLGVVIAGGRSTGVIVKSIVSGGLAEQNGCLRRGDHLLAINGILLHGMSSDQVANILRHLNDKTITITAGRSVDQAGRINLQYNCSNLFDAACNGHVTPEVHIVPTSIAINPVLFSRYLEEAGCLQGSLQPAQTSKDLQPTETFATLRMVVKRLKSENFGFSVADYNLGKGNGNGLIVASVSPLVFTDLVRPHDIIIRVLYCMLLRASQNEIMREVQIYSKKSVIIHTNNNLISLPHFLYSHRGVKPGLATAN